MQNNRYGVNIKTSMMIKARQLFSLWLVIGVSCASYAQGNNKANFTANFQNEYSPLSIGDKVPDFEFALVNATSSKARFSDFKGKYILIDFWATWCSTCLHHFSQLDSLQKEFNGSLQILLANEKNTRDDKEKLIEFFNKRKNKNGQKYGLTSIVSDTVLGKLFPHKLIPHYVWIDNGGFVKAITGSEAISKENIETFVDGGVLNFREKKDLIFTPSKPLFIDGNGGSNEKYIFRSMITGYIDGLPSSSGIFYNEAKKVIRILNTNNTILALYRMAYPDIATLPMNRIVIHSSLPLYYSSNDEWDSWKYNNAYSYELLTPPVTKENAIQMMRDDLAKTFRLDIRCKKSIRECYVIKKKGIRLASSIASNPKTNIYEIDNIPKYINGYPLSTLVNYLNENVTIPVLDETGYSKPINMDLPVDLTDMRSLKKCLANYGFELVKEKRSIDFYIISGTNTQD